MYLCESRWKVQSMEECYSYGHEEGDEPLAFQRDFAVVDPQFCGGAFHIDDRQFWMTMIFFGYMRRTGYPRVDNALEVLFQRTQENGGRLPRCGRCGARGPDTLRRCTRCKSVNYCDRA